MQSVNGVGLVSLDDNQGAYYSPGQIPPASEGGTPQPRAATALALVSPPTVADYNTAPVVQARLTSGGVALAGQPVTLSIGASDRTVFTDATGLASVAVPVIDRPADTTVGAAFDGNAAYVGSSASAPFTVRRLASALALSVAAPSAPIGADTRTTATLTSGGVPLAQKTVAFVLTRTVAPVDRRHARHRPVRPRQPRRRHRAARRGPAGDRRLQRHGVLRAARARASPCRPT